MTTCRCGHDIYYCTANHTDDKGPRWHHRHILDQHDGQPATTPKLAALDARIAAATDPDVAAEYRHYRDRIVSRA